MDFFTAMEVSASGMTAQRTRMNTASSNLANATTTETPGGGPFKRLDVILKSAQATGGISGASAGGATPAVNGVMVDGIIQDQSPPRLEYDPGHPDANADGYVAYPNVNIVEEMVDMITASRAYEAGVNSLNTAVTMAERALTIGK
jgi:flagellar basal-body rod protein FlgC